jgi:DNA-binding response OmpR family regulator
VADATVEEGNCGVTHTVLVVDDEPNIVLSLEFLMEQAGHDVRIARNGEQALAAIRADKPDLILLDIMMPEPDGFSVCKSVRGDPALQDIPIIMLTAKGREAERELGLAAGATDFITKPFSNRDVVERVDALLTRSG